MRQRGALLTGLGLALAGVYLLDPKRGPYRRARLVHGVDRAARISGKAVAVGGGHVIRRTAAAASRLRHVLAHAPVDDEVLSERVRGAIEGAVTHPYAIEVETNGGVVTLRGPIPQWETDELMYAVTLVPGVREVHSELEPHKMTWNVPALQGGWTRSGQRPRRNGRNSLSARP
jgi:hypothetical protein